MFAIIRTRWQTRPLSPRAKRRSSIAPGSLRKKYAAIAYPPNMVPLPISSTTSGLHRKPVLLRDAGLAFGDPGLHLVVVVGEIILGDVVGGGGPNAVMPEDVAQCLVEMLGGVRPADIVRVQRQTHDPSVLGTLAVERVELVPDHLLEVIRLAVPGEHA